MSEIIVTQPPLKLYVRFFFKIPPHTKNTTFYSLSSCCTRFVARCAGVAVAGSGVGTFVFAPLTDSLLTKYQWRGALVVCSAILLNVVVCGAVFRPLDTAARRLRLRRLSSLPANMATAPGGTSDAVLGHARSSAADMSALSSGRLVPIHRSRVAGTALDESAASIVSIDLLHDVEIHSSPSSVTGSKFERKNSRIFFHFFSKFR